MLLTFDQKDIATRLHKLGRTGWACQVFDVQVAPDVAGTNHLSKEPITFPALGRQVHMNAATDEIENITLMYCPPDRRVRVKVPLKVYGEEVCPGLKAGGRINWISRTIACVARGDQVPEGFEVDVSNLEIKEKLTYADLDVPEGVELAVKDKDLPILKIMKK
jgi:large subunit ribosomal protein L25